MNWLFVVSSIFAKIVCIFFFQFHENCLTICLPISWNIFWLFVFQFLESCLTICLQISWKKCLTISVFEFHDGNQESAKLTAFKMSAVVHWTMQCSIRLKIDFADFIFTVLSDDASSATGVSNSFVLSVPPGKTFFWYVGCTLALALTTVIFTVWRDKNFYLYRGGNILSETNFSYTNTETFLTRPNFLRPILRLYFSETKFSDTDTKTF